MPPLTLALAGMRHVIAVAVLGVTTMAVDPAYAGGSAAEVVSASFDRNGDEFVLVVLPQKAESSRHVDPYMGNCQRFEVRGVFAPPRRGPFGKRQVTAKQHASALEYLTEKSAAKDPIMLGWMGGGYVRVDSADPCIVLSRGLKLMETQAEIPLAVVSYHDAI